MLFILHLLFFYHFMLCAWRLCQLTHQRTSVKNTSKNTWSYRILFRFVQLHFFLSLSFLPISISFSQFVEVGEEAMNLRSVNLMIPQELSQIEHVAGFYFNIRSPRLNPFSSIPGPTHALVPRMPLFSITSERAKENSTSPRTVTYYYALINSEGIHMDYTGLPVNYNKHDHATLTFNMGVYVSPGQTYSIVW